LRKEGGKKVVYVAISQKLACSIREKAQEKKLRRVEKSEVACVAKL